MKTLVVCHSENHIKAVKEAFGLDAHYVSWAQAIGGMRFDKIILFNLRSESTTVQGAFDRFAEEDLPCKLMIGGKIVVV